eukprot:11308711-Alexandrium_andersonii.AAC.1
MSLARGSGMLLRENGVALHFLGFGAKGLQDRKGMLLKRGFIDRGQIHMLGLPCSTAWPRV